MHYRARCDFIWLISHFARDFYEEISLAFDLAMLPDIDFFKIRKLKTSQNKGFEELCVEVFRSSFPSPKPKFYRVGGAGGDGGVEDLALCEDGKKIGLQAKLIENLGKSQWDQINKSATTALKTHSPDLVEYRIACPCNRKKDAKSWDNHCAKWNEYAKKLGYSGKVEFVWWGETELRSKLIKEENRDIVHYWFGCKQFTDEWLDRKFDDSVESLDTRYTPLQHVRTESEQKLDAFLLTDGFQKAFWERIRSAITCARKVRKALDEAKDKEVDKERESLVEEIERFSEVLCEDFGYPPISSCREKIQALDDRTLEIYRKYEDRRERLVSLPKKEDKGGYSSRPFSSQMQQLDELLQVIQDARDFIERFRDYDSQKTLVLGEAGAGKSHLLANAVKKALQRGQPALLLLGEQFQSGDDPLSTICKILGWEEGVESLLGAMNSAAAVCGKPAVIAIDALNESERKIWKSHLIQTASKVTQHPNLRLLISCRSDFAQFVLPESMTEFKSQEWSIIHHEGYGEDVFEAVVSYFERYKVKCDHFPPIHEEFRNPLFLKTFCEAYEHSSVPPGPLSFDEIMEKRISKCQEQISKVIDCSPQKTKTAIDLLASRIAKNKGHAVPRDEYCHEVDQIFNDAGESRSLYAHLKSNGMIVETRRYSGDPGDPPEEMVRFPYEMFSDYFIAARLLGDHKTAKNLTADWYPMGLPDKWIKDWNERGGWIVHHENQGLLGMMAILVPSRIGCEFIDIFQEKELPRSLCMDFLSSLPWRTAETITPRTSAILSWCESNINDEGFLTEWLRLVTIPDHPFNARRLHEKLSGMKLWEREQCWTIPITHLYSSGDGNTVSEIIKWAFNVPSDSVFDEQAWLVALFLAWLLSTNHRFLRDRASLALIRILNGRSNLAEKLIDEFHDCNDPYVVERVYAAACGVALREKNDEALGKLARVAYLRMFNGDTVPPHILQREYAQIIIEYADFRGVLPSEVNIDRCRPIFRSKWPRIITEVKAHEIEKQDGWYNIKKSIQPNEKGYGYGDFGRYVMESRIHYFSRRTFKQLPQTDGTRSNGFSGIIARRYILQRIRQLGWTSKRFGDTEKNLNRGRMRFDQEAGKVERISKKYQWIALYELLGYLSDRFRLCCDYGSKDEPKYKGARQIWAREAFDPTAPLVDPRERLNLADKDGLSGEEPDRWRDSYPDPFKDLALRSDRQRWVMAKPNDFASLIDRPSVPDHSGGWLTLSCHYNWNETLTTSQDESIEGQLKCGPKCAVG